MTNRKTRRRYTKEFKLEAIELTRQRGGDVSGVAANLRIHPNMLRRWIKAYDEDPEYSFPGQGNLKTPEERMRQLKKKLKETEQERDILKKLWLFSPKHRAEKQHISKSISMNFQ